MPANHPPTAVCHQNEGQRESGEEESECGGWEVGRSKGDPGGGWGTAPCLMPLMVGHMDSNAPFWAWAFNAPIHRKASVIAIKVALQVTHKPSSNPTNYSCNGDTDLLKVVSSDESPLPSAIWAPDREAMHYADRILSDKGINRRQRKRIGDISNGRS